MLSIGKLTVEQSRYSERQVAQGRDDYYSGRGESPGRWTGAGAETIGLGGRVDDDGFMALMDGRDPGTGERLKRVGRRSKVAAFDLTFSAPKSVSVLFAVSEPGLAGALVEAHESAVDAAVGYLEREACRVRRGRGGVRREVGDGFVAAAYRHRMSRAEDPQLHTHVVAANMARGVDGRRTALDATPIYQHAKAAGFLYQAHLRAAVRERLPWVRWGPVRDGMAEIEQLSPEVLGEFSTRRRQIVERERELVAAGVEVGDSDQRREAAAARPGGAEPRARGRRTSSSMSLDVQATRTPNQRAEQSPERHVEEGEGHGRRSSPFSRKRGRDTNTGALQGRSCCRPAAASGHQRRPRRPQRRLGGVGGRQLKRPAGPRRLGA